MIKKSIIKELNEDLLNGRCPDVLTYKIEPKSNIDFYKLWYNDYYKSIDYISKKYSLGFDSIPGFELVLEEMAKTTLTPLEEIELRQQKINNLDNNNGEHTVISQ